MPSSVSAPTPQSLRTNPCNVGDPAVGLHPKRWDPLNEIRLRNSGFRLRPHDHPAFV
ncbi:hypothetical protein M413DRAFT_448650 [Hebeloma cylindrosporum]|uniref:Uncharacterized protein n=1 Tax=Hebeloma cylindrosporum TaxID=76867 RepID=A0A0C3BYN2_HEBCY|nr:hypothetical protein M413DRAFT_448650 [Hebeloma cylindrosporum h7]